MPNTTCTVAVVGAGMSGLVAARELQRAGVDVHVFEAASRLGGRTQTLTSTLGSRLDVGGQWVGHGHHRFIDLADECGAQRFQMHTPAMPGILDGGKRVALWHPSVIAAIAAMVGLEVLTLLPKTPDRWNSLRLDSVLQRIPLARTRELLRTIAEVSTTGDPERLSLQALIAIIGHEGGLRAMARTKGGAQDSLLVDGVGAVIDSLASELGAAVHLDHHVTAIDHASDGVTLQTTQGSVLAERAILTVPPPLISDITVTPALPRSRDALAQNTHMGSVYKAIAVYNRPFWRDRADAELLSIDSSGGKLAGFGAFDTTAPGGPGHLCFLVAGAAARTFDDFTTAERQAALLGPLADRLGAAIRSPVDWHEKSWHLDEFVGGGYTSLPTLGTRDGFLPLDHRPTGPLHWAGSETATDHAGYIEGAIQAGQRAAHEVLGQ